MAYEKKFWKFLISGFVLLFSCFLIWIASAHHQLAIYNPESADPGGYKALKLLLEQNGYTLQPLSATSVSNLERSQILVMLTNGKMTLKQTTMIQTWIENGGKIVEIANAKPLFDPDKSEWVTDCKEQPSNAALSDFAELVYTIKVTSLYIGNNPSSQGYRLNDGYVIYRKQLGRGQGLFWNDAEGLTNQNLKSSPNNAVIFTLFLKQLGTPQRIGFYNLLAQSAVDEKTTSPELAWLNHYWTAFLSGLFSLGFGLWKAATRFGRPKPLQLSDGRSSAEFIHSLAALFQQAGQRLVILENLWKALIGQVSNLTGLPVDSPASLQCQVLARYDRDWAEKIESLAQTMTTITENKLTRKSFVQIAYQMDYYRKELQTWKISDKFLKT